MFGEIKEDAILCVVTLSQLLNRLPSLPGNDDPFGLRHLQPSEPLRESSQCLCESTECLCRSSKPLHKVRKLVRKNALSANFSSGKIVGMLLKALNMPTDYLNEGVSIIAKDWGFRSWRNNALFKKGVANGFRENGLAKFLDLDQIGCSRLKTTLKTATAMLSQEKIHETLIYSNSEDMCWSSDTIPEDCCDKQEPSKFSFNKFMQELGNAAGISGPARA